MCFLRDDGWVTLRVSDVTSGRVVPQRSVVITFDDGFANNFEGGFKVLADLDMRATWFVVTQDLGGMSRWDDPLVSSRLMLSLPQIREMDKAGMEIGGHSRSHVDLTTLNAETLRNEVGGSKADLEQVLGHSICSFAYPYGRYNERCIDVVREAGYRAGVTTNPGFVTECTDLFQIPRVAVFYDDTLSMFVRKLVLASTEVGWAKVLRRSAGQSSHA